MSEETPIRIECECMTFTLAARLNAELEKLGEIKDTQLARKVAHMQKIVDGLLEGKAAHERQRRDAVKEVLGIVKRREMRMGAANKKIVTVPWEVQVEPKKGAKKRKKK